jgi:hypothetical protein
MYHRRRWRRCQTGAAQKDENIAYEKALISVMGA